MTVRAGELRPSQAITQSGPGSLVDLPTLSMVMAGIDDWNAGTARRVDEPRLAKRLHVDTFREPPFYRWADGVGGLPARIFPDFLVCPRCNRLATHDRFEFDPDRARHLCKAPSCSGAGKAVAYPARYIVACPRGHLDDFPWHAYIHGPDVHCADDLTLEDTGRTGAITDIWVKCASHGLSKNLGQAFGVAARKKLPHCSGRRPWFADHDPDGCTEEPRVLLRGASNAYFPVTESAISIPPWSDPIQIAIGGYVDQLAKIDTREKFELWLSITNVPDLDAFAPEQLWAALSRRRGNEDAPVSLKEEEWRAFQTTSIKIDPRSEFKARRGTVPPAFTDWLQEVVLLERLREVRVLRGFTRIDPVPDVGDLGEVEAVQAGLAPIRKAIKNWLPGVEFRGEGILLQLNEDRLTAWEGSPPVVDFAKKLAEADLRWHSARGLASAAVRTPRLVLLHSLSHLVVRQLALDCGYSSASLRERIYSTRSAVPMAGILIYTATPDAEGSLGGLVEQGRVESLGPLIDRALFDAHLCANDPMCADRDVGDAAALNGSACHACLLISETACESGNHYLDRGVLVPTVRDADHAFFRS